MNRAGIVMNPGFSEIKALRLPVRVLMKTGRGAAG
jgi:hypothetical protein